MKKQNLNYLRDCCMETIKNVVFMLLIFLLGSTIISAKDKNSNNDPVDCFYTGIQKVYLQLNKEVYITGEDVLFNCYLVNAANIPDTFCKVVYVELASSNNQKILGFSVSLFKGIGNSYFSLPDTLTTGYYYIKAFTNNMRNFEHDYYFYAKILIANQADDRLEKLITDNYHNIDSARVLFYPQSGNLINGIENKILLQLSDFSEDWEKQSVNIINDSGKIVKTVIPDNTGIGTFNLIPEKNSKYFALWNRKKFELPQQVSSGFIIQTETDGNVTILSNSLEMSDILNFRAYNNGSIIFEKKFTLSNGSATFSIPVENRKKGFTIFVLFNSYNRLLCKNAMYVHDDSAQVKITSNKTSYKTREKVILTIDLQDKGILKNGLNLSLNISQKGVYKTKCYTSTIKNYFCLKSNFDKKNSGLLESDSISEQQINKILPVFNFPKTISPVCQFLPENKGYILSGNIFSKDGKTVPDIPVYLSVADSFASFKYCFTDSTGRFFFRLSRFYENKNLIFQARGNNNDAVKIEIEDKYNGEPSKHVGFDYIPEDLRNFIKSTQNVVLANKIFKPGLLNLISDHMFDENLYNHHFYGATDVTIYLSDYDELDDFKDIVRNILPGVYYNRSENKVRVIDRGTQTLWHNEALVLLNNIPFPDPAFIDKLGTKQIKKIDLKKNHIIYGNIDLYGILSITTNQKNVYALNPALANITIPNIVRNVQVLLQGPDYSSNTSPKARPDLRQTLYWNPGLKLSDDGKASVEFYTSDLKGNYKVELEGISSKGVIIYSSTAIEVK